MKIHLGIDCASGHGVAQWRWATRAHLTNRYIINLSNAELSFLSSFQQRLTQPARLEIQFVNPLSISSGSVRFAKVCAYVNVVYPSGYSLGPPRYKSCRYASHEFSTAGLGVIHQAWTAARPPTTLLLVPPHDIDLFGLR